MMLHRLGTRPRSGHWLLILSFLLPLALAGSCTSTGAVVEYEPVIATPAPGSTEFTVSEDLRASKDWPVSHSVSPIPGKRLDIQSSGWPRQEDDLLEAHGSIWFTYANRFLSDGNWGALDRPSVLGFESMYEFVKELPFEIEFGFQYATADKNDPGTNLPLSYESFEAYLGIRRSWDTDFFSTSLYIGGGVTYNWINAKLLNGSGGTQDYKDQIVGGYAHTGFYLPLGSYLITGVDLRAMMAGYYDLGPNRLKADYVQGMLLVGFAW